MTDKPIFTAELRVKSCVVSQFPKPPKKPPIHFSQKTEEVWEVKAEGVWKEDIPYPISLHFTTYPGHQVIPPMGKIKITIEAL
jgi:hypothetical protein